MRHQAPVGSSGSGVDLGGLSSSGISSKGRELPNMYCSIIVVMRLSGVGILLVSDWSLCLVEMV